MFNWTCHIENDIVTRKYGNEDVTVVVSEFNQTTRETHARSFYNDNPSLLKTCTYSKVDLSISAEINKTGQLIRIKASSQKHWKKVKITLNHVKGHAVVTEVGKDQVISQELYQQLSALSLPLSDADIMYLRLFLL